MGLIVSDCVHEIEKNDTMFVTQSEHDVPIAGEMLSKLCPNDCMQQGDCVDGTTGDSLSVTHTLFVPNWGSHR